MTATTITFQIPTAPAWIARDPWSLAGWAAGWEHLRTLLIAANPAPECSHTWEECAASCSAREAWSSQIDAKMAALAPAATRAIEWSQTSAAEGNGYFGTLSCWTNSARRAVDALAI